MYIQQLTQHISYPKHLVVINGTIVTIIISLGVDDLYLFTYFKTTASLFKCHLMTGSVLFAVEHANNIPIHSVRAGDSLDRSISSYHAIFSL